MAFRVIHVKIQNTSILKHDTYFRELKIFFFLCISLHNVFLRHCNCLTLTDWKYLYKMSCAFII